jgi:RNA polymerase sigma factor (sigma-70 family)
VGRNLDINSLYKNTLAGHDDSEEKLFSALVVRFRLFVRLRVWNEVDCDDIVQNTMLVIAREYRQTEITTSFSAWAYKVLENRILRYLKEKKTETKRIGAMSPDLSASSSSEPDLRLEERLLKCMKKVAETNRNYARILNLCYQGYSTHEICEKLKITPNYSYVALSRARSMLEICLEKGEIE